MCSAPRSSRCQEEEQRTAAASRRRIGATIWATPAQATAAAAAAVIAAPYRPSRLVRSIPSSNRCECGGEDSDGALFDAVEAAAEQSRAAGRGSAAATPNVVTPKTPRELDLASIPEWPKVAGGEVAPNAASGDAFTSGSVQEWEVVEEAAVGDEDGDGALLAEGAAAEGCETSEDCATECTERMLRLCRHCVKALELGVCARTYCCRPPARSSRSFIQRMGLARSSHAMCMMVFDWRRRPISRDPHFD